MAKPTPLVEVQRAEMSPAARRALRALAEQTAALAAEVPPAKLWEKAQSLEVLKASAYEADGSLAGWAPSVPVSSIAANGKALAAALAAKKEPVALAASLSLLAAARPAAALDAFREALALDVGPGKVLANEIDTEAAFFHTTVNDVGPELAKRLPAEEVEALWAAGKLLGDAHVPFEVLTGSRWESLRAALRARPEGTGQQIYTVLAERADVATKAGKLAKLTELASTVEKGEEPLVGWLADALVEAKVSAVVPVLKAAEPRMKALVPGWSAAEVFGELGGAEVLDDVAGELPRLARELPWKWQVAYPPAALRAPVAATFAQDPARSTERFAPYFTPEAVASEAGATLARDILALGGGDPPDDVRARFGGKPMADSDPRWLDVAARLVIHPRLAFSARRFLGARPKPARAAALSRAGDPLAAGRGAKGDLEVPSSPRWLERYMAGAHEEVWRELHRLAKPPKGAARKEALAVLAETMRRARSNLARLAEGLRKHDKGVSKKALAAPIAGAEAEKAFADLEGFTGAPAPLAFRALHEVVGAVSFAGGRWWLSSLEEVQSKGASWRVDPLVIAPLDAVLGKTRAHRKHENALLPKDLHDPDVGLYLGPTPGSKAPSPRAADDEPAGSDDEPFLVFPTSGGVDGLVRQGPEVVVSFVAWLRAAVMNGGALPCRGWEVDPRLSPIEPASAGGRDGAAGILRELASQLEPF